MPVNGSYGLSHLEIHVTDLQAMRAFYADELEFAVTDEGGQGEGAMVFLSRHPAEHHQLVLSAGRAPGAERGVLDAERNVLNHVSFRLESLESLRALHGRLSEKPYGPIEEVTHGTTWSIYFRDPEGNRLECFVDTPWHIPQPCREPIDFSMSDGELHAWTERLCRERAGFCMREDWMARHAGEMAGRS